jgi:hypothetical protein
MMSAVTLAVHALFIQSNVSEDDDSIFWVSNSPSVNVYEDGYYVGTVHGDNCFGPIFDNSVYRLSAHDHGLNNDFSPLSEPYLVSDEEGPDDDADDELEFAESQLYFELNNTDGDLGIHGKVDGNEWQRVALEDPNGRVLIDLRNEGNLSIQGLTELFFESAEPTFDELDPIVFFARFPEGVYEWSGLTVEGDEIEGEAELSHKIPAAPRVAVNGMVIEGCDVSEVITANSDGSYTISWDEVTTRHPVLGTNPGLDDVEVDAYQFVLEREEQNVGGVEITELVVTMDLDAEVTEVTLPFGMVDFGQEIKNEILVRSEEGNQSATEFCWIAN